MTGAATTAQWLTCAAIGTGGGGVVLVLLKLAIDHDADRPHREPRPRPDQATPSLTVQPHGRHAAPHRPDETQPLICVQPLRARHSKGHPTWN